MHAWGNDLVMKNHYSLRNSGANVFEHDKNIIDFYFNIKSDLPHSLGFPWWLSW